MHVVEKVKGETRTKGPKGPVEQQGEHGTGSCDMKKEKGAGTMGIGRESGDSANA